jgi:hypothetical protein
MMFVWSVAMLIYGFIMVPFWVILSDITSLVNVDNIATFLLECFDSPISLDELVIYLNSFASLKMRLLEKVAELSSYSFSPVSDYSFKQIEFDQIPDYVSISGNVDDFNLKNLISIDDPSLILDTIYDFGDLQLNITINETEFGISNNSVAMNDNILFSEGGDRDIYDVLRRDGLVNVIWNDDILAVLNSLFDLEQIAPYILFMRYMYTILEIDDPRQTFRKTFREELSRATNISSVSPFQLATSLYKHVGSDFSAVGRFSGAFDESDGVLENANSLFRALEEPVITGNVTLYVKLYNTSLNMSESELIVNKQVSIASEFPLAHALRVLPPLASDVPDIIYSFLKEAPLNTSNKLDMLQQTREVATSIPPFSISPTLLRSLGASCSQICDCRHVERDSIRLYKILKQLSDTLLLHIVFVLIFTATLVISIVLLMMLSGPTPPPLNPKEESDGKRQVPFDKDALFLNVHSKTINS